MTEILYIDTFAVCTNYLRTLLYIPSEAFLYMKSGYFRSSLSIGEIPHLNTYVHCGSGETQRTFRGNRKIARKKLGVLFSRGTWGFAVFWCWCFFLLRWCGEKNPNLRCCGDLKPFGVRCLCFSLCVSGELKLLVMLWIRVWSFSDLNLEFVNPCSFSARLLSHVKGLSYKRAFPVTTKLKPIYRYQQYLRVCTHWQTHVLMCLLCG